MDPSLALVLIGLMQLGGLLVLAWYHLGVVKKQIDAVRLLGAFRKANHPADMVFLNDIVDGK